MSQLEGNIHLLPLVWTSLTFTDIDKTRTFIERSKSSPLNIYASNLDDEVYHDDALSLIIPHIPRLRSLTFRSDAIPNTLRNFHWHVPLLEDLEIHIDSPQAQILDIPLLNGGLLSLRTLSLIGDMIHLPQKKMSSLREFCLSCTPGWITVTQILDFLKSAPLLHTISIADSIPTSSKFPARADRNPRPPKDPRHHHGYGTSHLQAPPHPSRRII